MHRRRHEIDSSAVGWVSISDVFLILTILLLIVCLGLAGAGRRWAARADAAKVEAGEIKKIISLREAQAADLRQQLDAARDEAEKAARLAAERQKELESVRADLSATHAQLAAAQKAADAARQAAAAAETALADARRAADAADAADAQLAAVKAQLATANTQLASTGEQLASAKKTAADLEREAADLRGQVASAGKTIVLAEQQAKDLRRRVDAKENAEGKIRQELIGLTGDLEHVVFIVDSSGSMDWGGRWNYVLSTCETWVNRLPVKRAALIVFSDNVAVYPPDGSLKDMTDDGQRADLIAALHTYKPGGMTNTIGALRKAFEYNDLDSIVIFTDGQPTVGDMKPGIVKAEDARAAAIVDLVRAEQAKRAHKVRIHTIALGNYFAENFGPFLKQLADENEGTFIGR